MRGQCKVGVGFRPEAYKGGPWVSTPSGTGLSKISLFSQFFFTVSSFSKKEVAEIRGEKNGGR